MSDKPKKNQRAVTFKDPEIRALFTMLEAMGQFKKSSQARMLKYLWLRLTDSKVGLE